MELGFDDVVGCECLVATESRSHKRRDGGHCGGRWCPSGHATARVVHASEVLWRSPQLLFANFGGEFWTFGLDFGPQRRDTGADKDSCVLIFRLLALFCCINLLNYLDRGTIASNGVNGVPGDAGCLKDETCFHGSGIQ